ncbi:MAG: Hpt domain-containing protein, partial [Myxococcales bacterium]|nr:Hpt domain-containing protein [Myxococcales bacterium]
MSGDEDGVRAEFIAEAQEIIELLSRDLLVLDHGQKEGHPDPDLVNSVFRGVHTLKGIAGMFGFHDLGEVAHVLEDLLDQLRLGKTELSQDVLDVLFEGVEVLQRLLASAPDAPPPDLGQFHRKVQGQLGGAPAPTPDLDAFGLDTGVLSVLTEYEEHRLRTNIDQGVPLYRLRVRYALTSIDTDLEDLKSRAKPIAEIITYLPSMEGGDDDSIELEVLLASRATARELRNALALSDDADLEAVAKRGPSATIPPPPAKAPTQSPAVPATKHPSAAAPLAPVRDGGADALSLRAVAKTVRVDIGKLDHLMNVVGELAIVKSGVGKLLDRLRADPEMRALVAELHRIHRGFERHLDDLQDGILDVRMVPLGQTF